MAAGDVIGGPGSRQRQRLVPPTGWCCRGEAFCPFGGYETIWTWLSTGRTVAHIHTANVLLAAALLALALVFRDVDPWIAVLPWWSSS